jgi:hypothetical protein
MCRGRWGKGAGGGEYHVHIHTHTLVLMAAAGLLDSTKINHRDLGGSRRPTDRTNQLTDLPTDRPANCRLALSFHQTQTQVEAAILPFTTTTTASPAGGGDRSTLLGQLADKALDFLLRYLPSLPLPPVEGAT